MKKLVIAAILGLTSFGASAECMTIVSKSMDNAREAGVLTEKARSAEAIGLYLSTCDLALKYSRHNFMSYEKYVKQLEAQAEKLESQYTGVGYTNLFVGTFAFKNAVAK